MVNREGETLYHGNETTVRGDGRSGEFPNGTREEEDSTTICTS